MLLILTRIYRYSCQICDKLFRAPHYVEKHIVNKHHDKVETKVDSKRFDELLFNNFIKNPSKFTSSYLLDHYFILNEFNNFRSRGTFQPRRPGGYRHQRMDDRRRPGRYNEHRERREYIDYDDPNQNKKNERQLTNYDELFG